MLTMTPGVETADPLWLHAYSGKEHGMMVVGSPAAMRTLGQQLVAAANDLAPVTERWPKEIASPSVVGPYRDIGDFQFSFHLRGSSPLGEVAPMGRRTLHPLVFVTVTGCTVVGAVTILRWLLERAF
ncbi:MAG: hypothetical protein H7232_13440 [Aeromicrobium sp.]|nr:hypothetical protein [Burkholderiales bacterium]